MYTNTPDLRFVVGRLGPASLTLVAACSGHGFKFGPVMGEIAADLALDGRTAYDIAGFSPGRFSPSGRALPG
jgi:sarcosine oxidase